MADAKSATRGRPTHRRKDFAAIIAGPHYWITVKTKSGRVVRIPVEGKRRKAVGKGKASRASVRPFGGTAGRDVAYRAKGQGGASRKMAPGRGTEERIRAARVLAKGRKMGGTESLVGEERRIFNQSKRERINRLRERNVRLNQKATEGAAGVEFTTRSKHEAYSKLLVNRSTSEPGKWRLSYLDKEGVPAGHTTFSSRAAAVASASGSHDNGPAIGSRSFRVARVIKEKATPPPKRFDRKKAAQARAREGYGLVDAMAKGKEAKAKGLIDKAAKVYLDRDPKMSPARAKEIAGARVMDVFRRQNERMEAATRTADFSTSAGRRLERIYDRAADRRPSMSDLVQRYTGTRTLAADIGRGAQVPRAQRAARSTPAPTVKPASVAGPTLREQAAARRAAKGTADARERAAQALRDARRQLKNAREWSKPPTASNPGSLVYDKNVREELKATVKTIKADPTRAKTVRDAIRAQAVKAGTTYSFRENQRLNAMLLAAQATAKSRRKARSR